MTKKKSKVGGARYSEDGTLLTGRKPSGLDLKKKQFTLRKDQIEHIKKLGTYKGSPWVRDAVDEKIERDKGGE